MPRMLVLSLLFTLSIVAAPLAQVVEQPPRVSRGLFGAGAANENRWRHNVTLTGNMFGGFDDNLTPAAGDTASVNTNTPGTSGYSGFGGLQTQYSSVKADKTIQFDARGYTNGFHGLGLRRVFGGEASGRIATPLGARHSLTAFERYADTPMFAPHIASPASPLDGPVQPAAAPLANTTSYLIRRSQASDGSVTLDRRMTRTTTIVVGGSHARSRFDDGSGDTDSWGGTLSYRQSAGRRSAFVADYAFTSTKALASGTAPPRPYDNHNLTFSASTGRRLGPRRQLALSIGAGVNQVHTVDSQTGAPLSYRTPSGQASVRLDFARTWNAAADYARIVSVLEGVTLDTFITDTVSLRAGGQLWDRADIALSANWATGQAGPTGSGSYDSYTGILQLQFAVNRWLDALVSQTFYAYRLDGVTMVVEGMASELDRHAVRVGLVFRLPLYGQYVASRSGARR
jgi:hypothetical protein